MIKDPFEEIGKTSINISQEESTRLSTAINELKKAGEVDLNTFIEANTNTSSLTNFSAFKTVVEKRYQLYESLSFNLHKISQKLKNENQKRVKDPQNPFSGANSGRQGQPQQQPQQAGLSHQDQTRLFHYQMFSKPHTEIFNFLKFKLKNAFKALGEYLKQLNSEPIQVALKMNTIGHYTSELEKIVDKVESEAGDDQGEDDGARISQVYQNLGAINQILTGSLQPQQAPQNTPKPTTNPTQPPPKVPETLETTNQTPRTSQTHQKSLNSQAHSPPRSRP